MKIPSIKSLSPREEEGRDEGKNKFPIPVGEGLLTHQCIGAEA